MRTLRQRGYEIDIYVHQLPAGASSRTYSAHDFIWRHAQLPYDLTVYQFGNSSHHDYAWPYAIRYPGLLVLHETRLHHARAAALLREKRTADYRAEFAWNHPDLSPDLAELAIRGFDSPLYYDWPMVRALVCKARLVAAHGGAAAELAALRPDSADRIVSVRLGEGEAISGERERDARRRVREQYGIADDAVVFGCFGGLTPEKRIPQILDAMQAVAPALPGLRLILAGEPAAHLDAVGEIAARGLQDCVTLTGYLESEEELTDHLAACDVSLNLRWPTARETSGPWLRALALGRPTIITDLAHLGDVPSLDPRTWRENIVSADRGQWAVVRNSASSQRSRASGQRATADRLRTPDPVCIAIDILDEDHSLRLAMRRLGSDASLRARLGRAAHAWWQREHSVDAMVDDYSRVIELAAARSAPDVELPPHLLNAGNDRLQALLAPFGSDVIARIPAPSDG